MILIPVIFLIGIVAIVFSLRRTGPSASECSLGACATELTENDNGKTFTYSSVATFSVLLQEKDNPRAELTCKPEGILESISDSTKTPGGFYRVKFKGAPGTCYLSDRIFGVHIVISDAR